MININRSTKINKRQKNMDGTLKTAVQIASKALEDKKGIDIRVIPLSKNNGMADALVIATGKSKTHVKGLSEEVEKKLAESGFEPQLEGMPENQWVLVDIGDIVVHIFLPETRDLYNLEKLWGLDIEEDMTEEELTG
jgi:ribosome-associated protein